MLISKIVVTHRTWYICNHNKQRKPALFTIRVLIFCSINKNSNFY